MINLLHYCDKLIVITYFMTWETYCIMNTEQTSKNIFTYIKTHYGDTILAKIRKLEKTLIRYSSYTNHLQFSLCCHHNKVLPKYLQLKSRIRLIKHTCSWRDKLIVIWTLNRQAKTFLRISESRLIILEEGLISLTM